LCIVFREGESLAEVIIAISPVFDERDVREGLSGGCCHRAMIPLHKEISWYIILEESMVEDG
jgi:hypothetical protein